MRFAPSPGRSSERCPLARPLVVALLIPFLLLASCSGGGAKYSSGKPPRPDLSERPVIPSSDQGLRMPWEVWALGRDLQGGALSDRVLLEADELVRRGDREAALRVYRSIDQRRLTPPEREAIALRIASTQLSLDEARGALTTLSSYFRNAGKSEAEVDPRFCLIFAYSYGRLLDFDQSLAWFSRTQRMAGAAGLREPAGLGVRLLLRSIESEALYSLSKNWTTDSFVYTFIGQERRRRVEPGYQLTKSSGPFWVMPGEEGASLNPPSLAERSVLGVILPLSGPFAALGKGTKQGIELAMEGRALPGVTLEVRDDAGDSLQSVAAARELVGAGQASIVLGPLLTEPALRVSEVLRIERRPIIAFAKSGSFPPGGGVYRLGPTPDSQVRSLVERVNLAYGYTRYALVYPQDASGEEFARAFRAEMEALGLQLVYESSYAKDDFAAMLPLAKELEEKGPQAVFFPDTLKSAVRFFSYLSGGNGTKVRPLGTASWDNSAELQQSRAVLDGAIFVSPFFKRSSRPEVVQFIDSYRARFGTDPDFLAAQGFDAATLALEGVRQARDNSTGLDESLSTLGLYQGLTGGISVRDDGELVRQFSVVNFERGAMVELGTERLTITSPENSGVPGAEEHEGDPAPGKAGALEGVNPPRAAYDFTSHETQSYMAPDAEPGF
jgi:ABC-type branched-subunit amino acid transport system substrate-binding protein